MTQLLVVTVVLAASLTAQRGPVGEFEMETDIGASARPGSSRFDSAGGTYTITGGGENMWFASDAFHFLWKRLSGDAVFTARVRFEGDGGNPHRKAGWMLRQDLEPDSPYVDLVVHGDGLTSLQYRTARGGATEEVQSPISKPETIRLERHGDVFEMWVAADGQPLRRTGTATVALRDPLYAGLAVCAHDTNRMETAMFSDVKIETGGRQ